MKKTLGAVGLTAVLVLAGAACESTGTGGATDAANREKAVSANILNTFERTQPIPERPWSQLRQNLIELETAQADTTQTTTFFFNQGVENPVQSCPSIGFPIASTSEISNPDQVVGHGGEGGYHEVVKQIDPNGIYSGDSTGTYVMCIDAQGRAYADYWEGFVQTVTGPARWNAGTHDVELVGPPSFTFSKGK